MVAMGNLLNNRHHLIGRVAFLELLSFEAQHHAFRLLDATAAR